MSRRTDPSRSSRSARGSTPKLAQALGQQDRSSPLQQQYVAGAQANVAQALGQAFARPRLMPTRLMYSSNRCRSISTALNPSPAASARDHRLGARGIRSSLPSAGRAIADRASVEFPARVDNAFQPVGLAAQQQDVARRAGWHRAGRPAAAPSPQDGDVTVDLAIAQLPEIGDGLAGDDPLHRPADAPR
jgi:hypothetical protein